LGYFSHRRGCLMVLMGGQAEGQACTDPGVRTPIVRRKEYLFYALYSLIFILQTMFLHMKTYLVCIAINPSYFINIILSILYLNWII
jgi:hypothetical protein